MSTFDRDTPLTEGERIRVEAFGLDLPEAECAAILESEPSSAGGE